MVTGGMPHTLEPTPMPIEMVGNRGMLKAVYLSDFTFICHPKLHQVA
jgi:hypothetical protein